MKKVLLGLLVVLAISANAQFKGSIGAELAMPMEDGFGVGFGASGGGEYAMADNMGITGQVGYIMLTTEMENASASLIPIQAGFKYYLQDNTSGVYLHGQLGFHTFRMSFEFMGQTMSGSSTNLSLGFGGGYMVNEHIDLGVRYNLIMGGSSKEDGGGSFGYLAARVAYVF